MLGKDIAVFVFFFCLVSVQGQVRPVPSNAVTLSGTALQTFVAAQPAGKAMIIPDGYYRVTGPLALKAGQTLWAPNPGKTIISGSVQLQTWTADTSRWYAAVTLDQGTDATNAECEVTSTNPCRRRDQVYYDGARLTRVMTLSSGGSGKFFADTTTNRVYVWDDPSGHLIEMIDATYGVSLTASNVTLDGLVFQHFASPAQQGAIFLNGCKNTTIRYCTSRYNHAAGLFMGSASGSHVYNSVFHSNGQIGVACNARGATGIVIERNELYDNNAEGFYIGDWESGGFKATNGPGIFRFNNVHDERGVGVWADVNANGWEFSDNRIANAWAGAIRCEISQNGKILRNRITFSGSDMGARTKSTNPTGWYGVASTAAININTSNGVEVAYNSIEGDQNLHGIVAISRDRRTDYGDEQRFGPWDLKNIDVHHNNVTLTFIEPSSNFPAKSGLAIVAISTYQATSGGPYVPVPGASSTSDYLNPAIKGIRFHDNTYRVPSMSQQRFIYGTGYNPSVTGTSYQSLGWDQNSIYLVGTEAPPTYNGASNNAEGYTSDGVTVSSLNSGGSSGTPFNVTIGTGSTIVSDKDNKAYGSTSYRFSDTTTSAFLSWDYLTSTNSHYGVLYVYMESISSTINLVEARSGSTKVYRLELTPEGLIRVKNNAGTAVLTFPDTSAIPLNTWSRVEWYWAPTSIRTWIYNTRGGIVADGDLTVSGTFGASANVFRFGNYYGGVTAVYNLDNIKIGASTKYGPVTV